MSKTVIKVEGLGKKYRIGQADKRPDNFREALAGAITAPIRRLRQLGAVPQLENEFWALRDVNFEVKEGEVVGIIGHNGAGKSTLLKILSRITTPTEGRAIIRGQVSSLLEVGTGFHPELTGRENIFLNGTILGMSHRDIRKKFDEIVDFAGVETFIDTPIKRYSSGMSVRLAFAVAAHLGTDIMIVDEVLAVGDIAFQRKCLDAMQREAQTGRTILFVSHNLNAVKSLCSRALLFAAGRLSLSTTTQRALEAYASVSLKNEVGVHRLHGKYVKSLEIVGSLSKCIISYEADVLVSVEYEAPTDFGNYLVGIRIIDKFGVTIFSSYNTDNESNAKALRGQIRRATCKIPGQMLLPGNYTLCVFCNTFSVGRLLYNEDHEMGFLIDDLGYKYGGQYEGVIRPVLEWNDSDQGTVARRRCSKLNME